MIISRLSIFMFGFVSRSRVHFDARTNYLPIYIRYIYVQYHTVGGYVLKVGVCYVIFCDLAREVDSNTTGRPTREESFWLLFFMSVQPCVKNAEQRIILFSYRIRDRINRRVQSIVFPVQSRVRILAIDIDSEELQ